MSTHRPRVAKVNHPKPQRAVKAAQASPNDALLETILDIVESNTQRICRLEDVFALETRQREEVAQALKAAKSLLQQRRRSA
jgi:hypothetical protein